MYCLRNVTDDIIWVGASDRRLAMFEGVYSVPNGVSYNSYLVLDDMTVLVDTVDKAVAEVFFENLEYALSGRKLDYVIVQHMEPDHSATLIRLLKAHPETVVVCSAMTAKMINQFFGLDVSGSAYIVGEGDILNVGRHEFTFVMAPMVHWPEVMVTYEKSERVLFSADAFGTFGALNGAIFADEVDFFGDYLGEARRYYANIVGKYGGQVSALLKKASALDIAMLCPLHGFVFRRAIGDYIEKYGLWSRYLPEENSVMIAYGSVYGHTANAADILAVCLRELGIKTRVFDVSVTPASEIVAESFRSSHLVFASATYNAGIFVTMESLLIDLLEHNMQSRTVAIIENGSWAPTSGKLMRDIVSRMKNMTLLDKSVSMLSSVNESAREGLMELADAIASSMPKAEAAEPKAQGSVDSAAIRSLSYGLFVLAARNGGMDNACIINTLSQLTDEPKRVSICVSKKNLTHDMIASSGEFCASVISESADFALFTRFGFSSGRDGDKFAGLPETRAANGLRYVSGGANAYISGKVISSVDCGTHTLFIAEVTEAAKLSAERSATYAYYFEHIKPKPQPREEKKVGFVCRICGYVYEGETLPADFICPICKHGADAFEPIK
ncbi:MAG: flavin reductase [Eubacteriales bacterium]|nr:flavin reductase [Eubacteriales bacterium]MDD3883073.1 flavin reductase [Eubacteriales bacterium]MDD4513624.1 flavin reductase [Eubacteriales bacterium]